jgi:hypothetical protein
MPRRRCAPVPQRFCRIQNSLNDPDVYGASAHSLCSAELRSNPLEHGRINAERNFTAIKDSEWDAGLMQESIAIAKIDGQKWK